MSMLSKFASVLGVLIATAASAQVAVRAQTLYTMDGGPISDGVVLINAEGKITAVGPAASTPVPNGYTVHECAFAMPGLIDVRSTAGLSGMYNVDHDQDVLETSSPIQPELRAFDAYNPREPLVGYLRSFGVTTVHTGHAPGKLITGQTVIVKTRGDTIDDAVVTPEFAVTATLGSSATEGGGKSPGTRGKQIAMLREELFKAQAYAKKHSGAGESSKAEETGEDGGDGEGGEEKKDKAPPARDLKLEALASVLAGDTPLIITADKMQDIASALRLGDEFGIRVWIDSAAEGHLMASELAAAGNPVLLRPAMGRYVGEAANGTLETAKIFTDAGVTFGMQTGYEAYVPKVRVILFEAAVAVGLGGLDREAGLRLITSTAASMLGLEDRIGSIEVGKDGDIAMYDGDPFEYTTHCVGTLIEGVFFPGEQDYVIGYPGAGGPEQR